MDLDQAPVYQSLTRPKMLFGLPHDVTVIFGFGVIVYAGAVNFNLVALGIGGALALIARPFLRRMFEREPLSLTLLQSYFRWPANLPHHSRETRNTPPERVAQSFYH